ncbi:MAG TPA: response regulator transcription factor [Mucilaginibacter sp.]|nr:response regulator transcription factor [Mucilaginibacter sp.]
MDINILLLDDHAIMLDGLEAVLKTEPGLNVIAKVTDPNLGLSYLKQEKTDLVITDYAMPEMDGATFAKHAKTIAPDVKIIVLSMHDEPHIIRDIMKIGTDGYILKKYAQQEVIHAINTVMTGRQYWSREVGQSLLRATQTANEQQELTEREIEVLKLLTEELSSREIAERLFISERTVETHRKNLLRKTKAINTVGLVKYAYQNKYC